jgi:hypothetical protein
MVPWDLFLGLVAVHLAVCKTPRLSRCRPGLGALFHATMKQLQGDHGSDDALRRRSGCHQTWATAVRAPSDLGGGGPSNLGGVRLCDLGGSSPA